jgi:hypothetical protein
MLQAGHVIHNPRAGIQAGRHHRRAARVDRDHNPRRRQPGHHGYHARKLFLHAHQSSTRPRALAAHIHNIGPGLRHRHPGRDRALRAAKPPAIGEGIRRDVQNAHHQRPRQ